MFGEYVHLMDHLRPHFIYELNVLIRELLTLNDHVEASNCFFGPPSQVSSTYWLIITIVYNW